MNIYLVGYMYCGKTTLGRQLAHRLGLPFADTDQIVEQRYHTSIPILFKKYGEAAFRKIEQQVLHDTLPSPADSSDLVVATGGGTPCFEDNMDWINSHGRSIYLKMSVEAICARASHAKKVRPLLAQLNENDRCRFVASQMAEREHYYCRAHIIFPAFNPNVEELLTRLRECDDL